MKFPSLESAVVWPEEVSLAFIIGGLLVLLFPPERAWLLYVLYLIGFITLFLVGIRARRKDDS